MLDYYNVLDTLGDEEKQVQATARQFLDTEAAPDIADYWERGEFPKHLIPPTGGDGATSAPTCRPSTEPPASTTYPTASSCTNWSALTPACGASPASRARWSCIPYTLTAPRSSGAEYLPRLASGEMIGCFGLTEHEGGSDPGAMSTTARKDGETYILNGAKMWITNGNIADVALVWAADDDGVARGFLVPTDTPGFTANKIQHKMSMRASVTSGACHGRLPRSRVRHAARRQRTARPAVLSDPGALRHNLGRSRRHRIRLSGRARLLAVALHVRNSPSRRANLCRTSWLTWWPTIRAAFCCPGAWRSSRTRAR